MTERDVGVPGAVVRALRALAERIPPSEMDRVWIFPPRADGRKESGIVAAGCYRQGNGRLLVTLAYRAEETGKGITFHPMFQEEGEAPEDRLPRVMQGVILRSKDPLGVSRSVPIEGDPDAFRRLLDEWTDPEPVTTGSPRFRSEEGKPR